jgi:H+/Cl- antiporter ClcA
MPFRWNPREHVALGRYVLKWLLLGIPVGALIGSAVAGFLWSLEKATEVRFATDLPSGIPWLLFLLPVGGVGVGLLYHRFGKSVEGGNNLIVEQIHEPGGGVPARMAPLVLLGTVLTHLFGGSAGREGTAVQMGGSIASTVGRWLRLDAVDTRTLLMCGIAAGFGAVFGTPLTGALFALEVLAIGLVSYQALVPCLIASIAGDWATRACGIHHTSYHIGALVQTQLVSRVPDLNWLMLAKVGAASVVFGLASVLFAELTHGLNRAFKWAMPVPYLRPALGAVVVIGLAFAIGPDYLGLGVTPDPHHPHQVCILNCFHTEGATALSWWWKTLFTAVTLSCGFKGGEVTPLFFIGAALGNAMARLLHAPVDLFAWLGFVAVFAGATNTPIACTVMGIELFAGSQADLLNGGFVVYLATACFVAYLMSGHSGIYLSQRIGHAKVVSSLPPPGANLRAARERNRLVGADLLAVLTREGGRAAEPDN